MSSCGSLFNNCFSGGYEYRLGPCSRGTLTGDSSTSIFMCSLRFGPCGGQRYTYRGYHRILLCNAPAGMCVAPVRALGVKIHLLGVPPHLACWPQFVPGLFWTVEAGPKPRSWPGTCFGGLAGGLMPTGGTPSITAAAVDASTDPLSSMVVLLRSYLDTAVSQ